MARPKGSKNVIDLDQAISTITHRIKERVGALKQEIEARQGELERLSDQYQRLTGGSVGGGFASRGRGRPAGSGAASSATRGRGGKRIRRQGVDMSWISGHLEKQPMTLKQLQAVAQREGRSALSVMNVLRTNKNKFKSSEGEKDPGVRGRAAQVWSAK